jgi:hypothetical protein
MWTRLIVYYALISKIGDADTVLASNNITAKEILAG